MPTYRSHDLKHTNTATLSNTAVKRDKAKARDAAFRLLYLLLSGESQDEHKDAMKMCNAVVFVTSHPGTFQMANQDGGADGV
jgi:hypothetical protein